MLGSEERCLGGLGLYREMANVDITPSKDFERYHVHDRRSIDPWNVGHM